MTNSQLPTPNSQTGQASHSEGLPLRGKCALITGSVRGLGLAAARRFAAAGCHLVMNGFGAAGDVDGLRRSIEQDHGVRTIYSSADLRRPEQIAQMAAAAFDAFGAVDILVNNAVVRHSAPVEAFDPDAWDEGLAVNVTAAFHTIRLVIPEMKRRKWGRIVNVSSIYGLRGAVNRVNYVTSKTALLGMTRAVAMETVAHGITCNAVCPGTTESPVHDEAIESLMTGGLARPDAERRYFLGKQPSGRFIPAESVAALMVFLCLPEAAHITGAALPIDDGWAIS
jgi:3-hydroxybutyrate dehydrogenase